MGDNLPRPNRRPRPRLQQSEEEARKLREEQHVAELQRKVPDLEDEHKVRADKLAGAPHIPQAMKFADPPRRLLSDDVEIPAALQLSASSLSIGLALFLLARKYALWTKVPAREFSRSGEKARALREEQHVAELKRRAQDLEAEHKKVLADKLAEFEGRHREKMEAMEVSEEDRKRDAAAKQRSEEEEAREPREEQHVHNVYFTGKEDLQSIVNGCVAKSLRQWGMPDSTDPDESETTNSHGRVEFPATLALRAGCGQVAPEDFPVTLAFTFTRQSPAGRFRVLIAFHLGESPNDPSFADTPAARAEPATEASGPGGIEATDVATSPIAAQATAAPQAPGPENARDSRLGQRKAKYPSVEARSRSCQSHEARTDATVAARHREHSRQCALLASGLSRGAASPCGTSQNTAQAPSQNVPEVEVRDQLLRARIEKWLR